MCISCGFGPPSFSFAGDGWLPPLGQWSCLPLEELKGFILTPLICPNSATADWGRGFRPTPLPNHSAIEAAESGRTTDNEYKDDGELTERET